ncbi:TPA: hypothetical protein ACH3X1_001090 [Trebouxia sp. C0004]
MSEEMASQLYNKPEHRHTLVGNWQEEQKLLETTGNHRYKPWTKTDGGSPLYATRQDKPEQLPTFERVFAHSERLDSKDWKSQSQATYRSSQQCAKDPALYNDIPVAGIRTQLEMEAMLAEASTVAEAAPLPPQYQTNYQEEFQFCGPNTVRLGQRIMKTQDGTGDVCRDHTFLAESGMLPKVTCNFGSSMHSAPEAHGRLSAAAAHLVMLLLTCAQTFYCNRCITCTMHCLCYWYLSHCASSGVIWWCQ